MSDFVRLFLKANRKTLLIIGFILLFQDAFSKDKYWIFFSDKEMQNVADVNVSEKAIFNRKLLSLELIQFSDIPINRKYLNFLFVNRIEVICKSKWLNAVSAYLTQDEVQLVRKASFVKNISLITAQSVLASYNTDAEIENFALTQINSKAIEKENITGKNIPIGIIDGHFWKSKQNESLRHVFDNKRLLGVRDFVAAFDDHNFFDRGASNNDQHGMVVWQLITGFNKEKRQRYGLATNASFYLARTDDAQKEFRREEDYWISALEWMDSLGVRLVNSSLAYSLDYDNPLENYKPEEMNGETSSIAKAVKIAVKEKGMILVISAGNEGSNKDWRYISTPADAEDAISVGATDKYGLKAQFSGIGPPFLNYTKPDISCYSARGTSFSAPVITGLVACLLEKSPNLTSYEINQLLRKSGNLYPYGNNYLGDGIPDVGRIFQLVNHIEPDSDVAEEIREKDNKIFLSNKKYKSKVAIVFHKENEKVVVRQTVVLPEQHQFTIPKEPGIKRSTVVLDHSIIEVFWE